MTGSVSAPDVSQGHPLGRVSTTGSIQILIRPGRGVGMLCHKIKCKSPCFPAPAGAYPYSDSKPVVDTTANFQKPGLKEAFPYRHCP